MIEDRIGDIFAQKDLSHIVHQANLYRTFGSGIAKEVKARFPYAFQVDQITGHGDRSKLGWFTVGCPPEGSGLPFVVNLYSQAGISATQRTTHYAAMGKALFDLEEILSPGDPEDPIYVVGIPHGLGCGLAGGDWKIVRAIIESAFAESPVRVVICQLPATRIRS